MTARTREDDGRVRVVSGLDGGAAGPAAGTDAVSQRIDEIQRALRVLERLVSKKELRGEARTALRIRTMALVDRLEIEFGKRRMLEGNFAAARYHLAAVHERPFTLTLALLALRVAPRLLRATYLKLRPSSWRPRIAAERPRSDQKSA
jgi:hypothetical protein